MAINRSQKFVYFQNKANHYHKLKTMKSIVDHKPPEGHIPKGKIYRPVPLLKQHQIRVENEHLMDRIIKISQGHRAQIQVQGPYSRYNKIDRPFREQNPLKMQTERAITIDNSDLKHRLLNAKPAIGTNNYWSQQYSRSLCCKKNLSKYLENNRSKGQLHISTDRFVPQHLREYVLKDNLNASVQAKQTTIPMEKLFQLPQINKSERRVDWHFDDYKAKFGLNTQFL